MYKKQSAVDKEGKLTCGTPIKVVFNKLDMAN